MTVLQENEEELLGNGNGKTQSRTTRLEIAVAVLRNQFFNLRDRLQSHITDIKKEEEARELRHWQDAVDQELEEIRERHTAEDAIVKTEKSLLEREWKTIVFLVGVAFNIFTVLHDLKII